MAVAVHDVHPATFPKCLRIRSWLAAQGVERATLLVIPAADRHGFADRSPALRDWLLDRVSEGDEIAQHGLCHSASRRPRGLRGLHASLQGGSAAEFPGLDPSTTSVKVDLGLRILRDAGIEPRGFVAPAYAYTCALREALATRFEWWAELFTIRDAAARPRWAPACCLGTSTMAKRALSPAFARATAWGAGELLRLDVHPADFDHPRHVRALEAVLARSAGRRSVTYDDVVTHPAAVRYEKVVAH